MTRVASYILTALVAAAAGYSLILLTPVSHSPLAECHGKYPHIRPDFSCDEYTESTDILTTLRSTITQKVNQFELNGDAKRISIWVRDLSTLQWMGVRENEQYVPASLFKVPVMIAVYKYAEIQPDILKRTVTFQPSTFVPEIDKVAPEHRLTAGTTYTIEELVEQMIRYSDNEAYEILVRLLSPEFLTAVYADLGIVITASDTERSNLVTARSYANIFRSLYQGSYLTPVYSEKALSTLSHVDFEDGMRTAIPDSIQIAHKFGIRREVNAEGMTTSLKLHDCGIVYLPNHPYLYCILTDGTDEARLTAAISTLSKSIYQSFAR